MLRAVRHLLLPALLAPSALLLVHPSPTAAQADERPAVQPPELDPPLEPEKHAGPVDLHGDPLPEGAVARLGSIRFRYGSFVSQLLLSPDGKTVGAAGGGESVILWDLATGKVLWRFRHEDEEPYGYAAYFWQEGKTLLTKTERKLRLWDVSTGKLLGKFEFETQDKKATYGVVPAPDGRTIALTLTVIESQLPGGLLTRSGDVKLCDLVTGREIRRFGQHPAPIWFAAFSPDGKTLLTGSLSENNRNETPLVRRWDTSTGQMLSEIAFKGMLVTRMQFSPDGRHVAIFRNDSARLGGQVVQVWDVVAGRQLPFRNHIGSSERFAFSRDGKRLAIQTSQRPLGLWDVNTSTEVRQFPTQPAGARVLAFTPDDKTLLSADYEGVIHRWDVATGREVTHSDAHQEWLAVVAFSPDSQTVASAGGGDSIRLWAARTGKQLRCFRLSKQTIVRQLAFTPDGKTLIAGDDLQGVSFWDTATGEKVQPLVVPKGRWGSPALSADGKTLATLMPRPEDLKRSPPPGPGRPLSGNIQLWDLTTGNERAKLTDSAPVRAPFVFSPDGTILAARGARGLLLWEVASGRLLRECRGANAANQALAFSRDGKRLVGASGTGAVHVWETSSGSLTSEFQGCERANLYFLVVFAPDGKTLVTSGPDDQVRWWDAATGQQLGSLRGHCGYVSCVACSPDGKLLASGSTDTTVLVWNCQDFLQRR